MAPNGETISIYMDGHEGHRGHVLAHAWLQKLEALIGVLSSMERDYLGAHRRQSEYEVVEARKVNPTIVEIRPVARRAGYDPKPVFSWSAEQLESIADNGTADKRLSAATVEAISGLAKMPTSEAYRRFWINGHTAPVYFDEEFGERAAALARARRAHERRVDWFEGTTIGTVEGNLRLVDDLEGAHRFAIKPAVGPDHIECYYDPTLESDLRRFLFDTVRVYGRLTYNRHSPHPASVKVSKIEALSKPDSGLKSLKGILRGEKLPTGGIERLLRED